MKPRHPTLTVSILWLSVVGLGLLFPCWFWDGGNVERESATFIQQYTDERSAGQKVLNPLANDGGYYQGRELSYFFDYLDANAFLFLIRRGIVLYVPVSSFFSTLLTAVIWRAGTRKLFPALDPVLPPLVLLLLFTSFVYVSTMGMIYRSAKPLMAPLLLGLIFHLARATRPAVRDPGSRRSWDGLAAFALATLIGLFDRQGFFYVIVAFSILLVLVLLRRRCLDLLAGCGAAAALVHAYNVSLGPRLIHAFNGYWPDFEFQQFPYAKLWEDPHVWRGAAELLVLNAAGLFGSFHPLVILVPGGLAFWLLLRRAGTDRAAPALAVPIGLYVLTVFGPQVVMFSMMLIRWQWVYEWRDHWFWYYPLPFLMTLIFLFGVLLARIVPDLGQRGRALFACLLIALATSNLAHLTSYRTAMMSGEWFPYVHEQNQKLKLAVDGSADPAILATDFLGDYRGLYDLIRKHQGRATE